MNKHKAVLAVDVGGTKIATSIIDIEGRILKFSKIDTPKSTESVVNEIIDGIRKQIFEKIDNVSFLGIGLAVAGTISWLDGKIIQSPNLPFENIPLKEIIESNFDLPVLLDNDGNLAAFGETYFGAAKDKKHVIGLTLGTGIGAGIIVDGVIYRGVSGSAAEIGHMVIEASGPQCTCGSFGCFEEMASGRALERVAKNKVKEYKDSLILKLSNGNIEGIKGKMVTQAARQGDEAALECFVEIGYWLGIGLNNVINIFNPEVVVIGGGLAEAGDLIIKPAYKVISKQTLHPNKDLAKIELAKLGSNAGLYGAAALVLSKLNAIGI